MKCLAALLFILSTVPLLKCLAALYAECISINDMFGSISLIAVLVRGMLQNLDWNHTGIFISTISQMIINKIINIDIVSFMMHVLIRVS